MSSSASFVPSRTPTPTSDAENVQPLHHPEQTALMAKNVNIATIAKGHSEMGGKALLAKKMAASGQSFYSPTDTMVSPCTAKLHLAKKKHFNKGKPMALSSSFATSNTNPLQPNAQKVPFSNAGFLHPSHAVRAHSTLAHQGNNHTAADTQQGQQEREGQSQAEDSDVEMEM